LALLGLATGDESTDEATFDEFVSTFEFVGTVVL
jgi:hypothetical protein